MHTLLTSSRARNACRSSSSVGSSSSSARKRRSTSSRGGTSCAGQPASSAASSSCSSSGRLLGCWSRCLGFSICSGAFAINPYARNYTPQLKNYCTFTLSEISSLLSLRSFVNYPSSASSSICRMFALYARLPPFAPVHSRQSVASARRPLCRIAYLCSMTTRITPTYWRFVLLDRAATIIDVKWHAIEYLVRNKV
jgi:hypothetical protein